jgi:hypothetical protein
MGSPITQLSKAKFGIGGRVFNPIRDQRELFVYRGCGGVLHKYPHVINRNGVKVQVSGVKLEINLLLILISWGLYYLTF